MPVGLENSGCEFCKIVSGEERNVEVVGEGDGWIAFFPLAPATPGHTLVVPKTHVEDLWKFHSTQSAEIFDAVILVGQAIERVLKPEGMNLITSAGAAAEQSVFHLHLHLVPRWHRDGFGRIWPTEHTYNETELEVIARDIAKELKTERT